MYRTLRALLLAISLFSAAPLTPAAAGSPLQVVDAAGTTLALAQALDWLDGNTFAVGRWDGTVSVFRIPHGNEFGPVITGAAAAPSGHGVEMVAHIDGLTFASSDGPGRLAVLLLGVQFLDADQGSMFNAV